jgi:hypothetical protein
VLTFELQDEDTSDATLLEDLNDWVDNTWAFLWDQLADADMLLYLLEVDVLTTGGLVERNIGEEIHADAGGVAGDVMPAAVSAFMQMDTERAKSFGRKYLPGISEALIQEGILMPAPLAVVLLLLIELTADIPIGIAGLLVPGVLSRVTTGFLEFTGSGYATDVPAYQRRRKPGVGS